MSSVQFLSSQSTTHLSDLLHYDPAKKTKLPEVIKGLQEFGFLIAILKEATEVFENREYERFDALVGETACQIRAVRIAVIAKRNLIDVRSLHDRVETARNEWDSEVEKFNKVKKSSASLRSMLTDELDVKLSSHEMYMLQAFILTEIKSSLSNGEAESDLCMKDKSDPKKLHRDGFNISSTFIVRMTSYVRRLLSDASVKYVSNIAKDSGDPSLIKMTSPEFIYEHNTWPSLPMFWTYKVLLSALQKELVPVLFHVKFVEKKVGLYTDIDEETLFFKAVNSGCQYSYEMTEPNAVDLEQSACIIQGAVCVENPADPLFKKKWKENILNKNIHDIILCGAADHRQYPGLDKDISIPDAEYLDYKNRAGKEGFSIENPSTFFINHVYAAKARKFFPLNLESA